MSQAVVQLDSVLNFRDVGRTINEFLGERRMREGLFFRSARLDDASPRDISAMTDTLGIRTVIDLRTQTEHLEQLRKHEALEASTSPDTGQVIPVTPLRIPGFNYHDIRITGRAFELHILRQLTWWSLLKFLFLYFLNYRLQAISILGREVMAPRGLVALGLDTLDHSGEEIRQALCLYTDPESLPNLVHCTQGKDRTGLICALVLMILSTPIEAIEHDYFLTDPALQGEGLAERVAEIRSIGLPDHWAGTAPDMITGLRDHLQNQHGGLDCYLDGIGFMKEDRRKVRETLLY